jgi:hypothetical protein
LITLAQVRDGYRHEKVDGLRRCAVGQPDAADLLCAPSVSSRDHPVCGPALSRFTPSYRDAEELLAERGIETPYETVRRWALKFGPLFARDLRWLRPRPTSTWHLYKIVVSIQGRRRYLWRAGDSEGEVLDLLVQPKRN